MLKRTSLKKKPYTIKKVSEKQKVKKELKKEQSRLRHEMFLEIWDERELEENGVRFVRCFETNRVMLRDWYMENSCCYSHTLPKNKYPQYDLCKWNVEIILPDVHANWEMNQDKFPKLKARYEELLQKHLNNEL